MKERLERIPFMLIFVAYAAYMGYQLYEYHFDSEGQVEVHKAKVKALQDQNTGLKKKLVEGKKFLENLELKKKDIQSQVSKLEEFKGSMSESLDVPTMIKTMVTEAKRSGMRVDKIEPGKNNLREFYLEQEFKLDAHGSFAQILQFFLRVSQLQRILRIEAFTLKPQSLNSTLKNTTLETQLSVRSYQYVISKEDKIGKGDKK